MQSDFRVEVRTEGRAAVLFGAVGLLERAISYTLGNLPNVSPAAWSQPTPCRDWDLAALLAHMSESLVALQEAGDVGRVALSPVGEHGNPGAADPVSALRAQAGQLLGRWADTDADLVSVGGCPVSTSIVTSVGAVEIAVHGWDVARSIGRDPGFDADLVSAALAGALQVPEGDTRLAPGAAFRPGVPAPDDAPEMDRLLAVLGRSPTWPS